MDDIQKLLKNYNNQIQKLFTELKKLIYESVTSDIDEKLWAKLPSYYIGEKFVRLLPFKDHINVEAEAILNHEADLEQFKITPKGMLQIYPAQDLPCDVLKIIFSETLIR